MQQILTTLLILLTFSLFSQNRFEVNQNNGFVILNEITDSAFTTGGNFELGARYVFNRDTLDDGFQIFVGASAGLFRFKSQLTDRLYQSFTSRAYIGFTPIDAVYFSLNSSYHTSSNAFVPAARIEAQPFDRFLWTDKTRIKWAFYMEGGYIKYLDKSNSPTGFVSIGTEVLYQF